MVIKKEWQDLSPEQLVELSESTVIGFRYDRSELYKAAAEKYEAAGSEAERQNIVYEVLAFDLWARNDQGPRFHPMSSWTTEDGKPAGYPSRDSIGNDAITYYQQRARNTSNPLLRARYADIVWDFKPKGNFEFAKTALEAYLECAEIYVKNIQGPGHWGIKLADALERALAIAMQLNNKEQITKCLDRYSDTITELLATGDYRWILDILRSIVSRDKLKSQVDLRQLRSIAEEAILHYANNVSDSYNIQRSFLLVIASIWRLEGKDMEAQSTIRRVAVSYEDEAAWKRENYPSGHLVAIGFLEKALQTYAQLGDSPEKVDELKVTIGAEHGAAQSEYKRVESRIEIPKEAVDSWLDRYKGLTVEEALQILASDSNIVPSYKKAYDQAVAQAKEFVLQHIITTRVHTDEMSVKQISTEEEKLAYAAAANFRFAYAIAASLLLPQFLEKMQAEHEDCIIQIGTYILSSGIVDEGRRPMIEQALHSFGSGDYISCMHVLAPQIEGALRDILGLLGLPKTSFLAAGEWEAKALHPILETLSRVKGFEEDFIWLIRLFLGEKTGDNLRNEIGHGLAAPDKFTKENAMIMIYILVKLSSYRIVATEGEVEPETNG